MCGCGDLPWSCAAFIPSRSACRMQPCGALLGLESRGARQSSIFLVPYFSGNTKESSILKFGKDLDLAVHSFWIFFFVIPHGASL